MDVNSINNINESNNSKNNININNNNSSDHNGMVLGTIDSRKRKIDEISNEIVIIRDMNYLFYKVFKNKYLRTIILGHSKIYSLVYFKHKLHTMKELETFSYRTYVTTLYLTKDKELKGSVIRSNDNNKLAPNCIPYSTVLIKFERDLDLKQGDIPSNVKFIRFDQQFKSTIDMDIIPAGVINLVFSKRTTAIMSNSTKSFNSLQMLTVDSKSSHILQHQDHFKSLTKLNIFNYPDVVCNFQIPSTIKHLAFGPDFTKEIPPIPTGVIEIEIHGKYSKPIILPRFPLGLRKCEIVSSYNFFCIMDFFRFKSLEFLCFCSKESTKINISNCKQLFPNLKFLKINNDLIFDEEDYMHSKRKGVCELLSLTL